MAASSPASDPLVTSVGGTELHAADYCVTSLGCNPTQNPAPGTYQGEVAWNEPDPVSGDIATGGGFSVLYKAPFFQVLASRGAKQRGVPDVAYSAPSSTVCLRASLGTGASSAEQAPARRNGRPSPRLSTRRPDATWVSSTQGSYLFGALPGLYSTIFHDVESGSNSLVEYDINNDPVAVQGLNAGKGWDATTGLGSPRADQLVNFLTRFTSWSDGNRAIQTSDPGSNGRSGHHRVGPH